MKSLPDNKYTTIFFDFGDTLSFNNQTFPQGLHKLLGAIDIDISINILKEAVSKADRELAEERMKARSVKDYEVFRIKYYNYVLDILGYSQEDDKIAEYIHNTIPYYHNTYLMPETLYVLSVLRQEGYKLGIVSNFDHSLPRICDNLGITEQFNFITYSDDVGYEKPAPHIFEDALKKANENPTGVIHVGDSYGADVLGAMAMGITPILLCDNSKYKDCISINNLIDLLSLLGIIS